MGKRKAANAKRVIWNGKEYPTMLSLCQDLGVGKGYLNWYIENDKPVKGHHIDFPL